VAKSRLASVQKVPYQYGRSQFADIFNLIDQKVNDLSDGKIAGVNNAATTIPTGFTVGTYAKGDLVRNSNPSVVVTSTGNYVVLAWLCINDATSVGAFVPCKVLT
jgi:hypothetical protein